MRILVFFQYKTEISGYFKHTFSYLFNRMKSLAILVVFWEFVMVTSLHNQNGVSLSLNAPKKIPIRGFLLDDNNDKGLSSKLKSIEKLMKSQQDQLNNIIAVSKNNSNSVSEIKSDLTDLTNAVTGLQKATRKQADPAKGGLYPLYTIKNKDCNNISSIAYKTS